MELLFRIVRPEEVEQELTQKDQFNTDKVPLAATLVRESHQEQGSIDISATSNDKPCSTAILIGKRFSARWQTKIRRQKAKPADRKAAAGDALGQAHDYSRAGEIPHSRPHPKPWLPAGPSTAM